MTDNEIKREITFEEEFSCLEKDVKDFFGNYENQSDGEDCIEVCLIRSGYRAAKKAREENNRQKAEIEKLQKVIFKKEDNMQILHKRHQKTIDELQFAKAEIEKLGEEVRLAHNVIKRTFLLKAGLMNDPFTEIKSKARREFAERLCKDRVLNDPVVIAVKAELKMMESERK